jgi:hypothetical protein
MIIFDADDPLVINGTYDREGYKPDERARIAKARARQHERTEPMPNTKRGRRASRMDRKLAKPDAPKRGRPRSQTLPGLDQVRNGKLDNLCEGIADVRATMNEAKQEEKGLIAAALQTMVAKGVTVYKHGGVELARVPGAETLRVRLVKAQGDADADDLEEATDADDEAEADDEAPSW